MEAFFFIWRFEFKSFGLRGFSVFFGVNGEEGLVNIEFVDLCLGLE